MTPLSPEEIERMLSRPGVTYEDIAEYERLNVEHVYAHLSSPARFEAEAPAREARETRRAELFRKLYGRTPGEPPGE